MKYNQSGRSMIEMLGVLAIIGVLSVGGIAGYTKAMSKYRTNKVIDQAAMLVTNIRTMFAQQQTYSGLDNDFALDLALVPDEMVGANARSSNTSFNFNSGTILNAFGGKVAIKVSSLQGAPSNTNVDDGAFTVSFYGVSRDACIAIATSDWGAGSSSGLMGLYVGGSTIGAEPTNANDVPAALDGISKSESEGSANDGAYVAVPGGSKVKIPMTVAQARQACKCLQTTDCFVGWKYF